ncbi:hypothetical protein [Nonomuraea recticatena]
MEQAVDDFFARYGRRRRKLEHIWRPWVAYVVLWEVCSHTWR